MCKFMYVFIQRNKRIDSNIDKIYLGVRIETIEFITRQFVKNKYITNI